MSFAHSCLGVTAHRAGVVQNLADELIEEGYPEPEKIRARAGEVKALWEEFKELAAARLEALQGAKQVCSLFPVNLVPISYYRCYHQPLDFLAFIQFLLLPRYIRVPTGPLV